MEQQRSRIVEDLRGLLTGEVTSGDITRQLYATDASLQQVVPTAVVFPQSTADVSSCLRYCQENEIPVHARGAGTGLAGESLGNGIVLDFARSMRRVLAEDGERVRVQPGIAYERLNAFLAERGRHLGPQPHNRAAGTLGGMLGVNASGSRGLKYGAIRTYVEAMQVVLADGSVLELDSQRPSAKADDPSLSLRKRLAALLAANSETLDSAFEGKPDWDVGYHVNLGHSSPDEIDLRRMVVGSEGTLAVVTEATLTTSAAPRYRAAALLFFDSLDKAARGAVEVATLEPSACDLIDRRQLMLAREWDSFYQLVVPTTAEAMLFVEHEANDLVEVRDRVQRTVDRLRRRKRLAFDSRQAFDDAEFRLFWQLATPVAPLFYRLGGRSRPVPFAEDVIVPPEALPQLIVSVQNTLKEQQLTAAIFAHAGKGRLQTRPIVDPASTTDVARLPAFADKVYSAAIELGGAISGGAGLGISRTLYLPRQFDESLLRVLRQIKRTFDPGQLLNPGKMTASPEPLEHMRPGWKFPVSSLSSHKLPLPENEVAHEQAESVTTLTHEDSGSDVLPDEESVQPSPKLVSLQLAWNRDEALNAAWQCNGCGDCRTQASTERMCPLFRAAPAEIASPRAKANAMRSLLSGELNSDVIASEEFKELVDTCVNCHMCRLECPAATDIPQLMTEARGQYVAAKGLRFSDWIVSRLDILGRIANHRTANWVLHNRTMRWILEKTIGLAQGRKLPKYTRRTFLRSAHRRRLTRPTMRSDRKVAYFFDHYVNFHDPELGDAVVAILEQHGIAVYVPPKQKLSGMSMISVGNLDRARKVAEHNLAILADCVRQGYHIVANEPAAVLCLTREYQNLLGSPDAQLVAQNSSEVCQYLLRLHERGELRLDFQPLAGTLAYHTPCHLKALEMGTPGIELLRLIPGLSIRKVDEGCSGMAGTYGLKKHNYRASLRAGWGLISKVRQSDFQFGATECSACKMQMEQGTTKPTIHPLKLLAKSYGLMQAELHDLLRRKNNEFTVT
ncbi:MAG: anaerobic glycerol-3-phosphate dehydrogenase subunit C [Pirellulales bacterium]|nr:anaerobic glycerol-3-phosphate dehydrogenase subunit C [Pirellulales bacterium]